MPNLKAGMIYRTHTPRSPLSQWIELIWLYESGPLAHGLGHRLEKVLPHGTVELIINLQDEDLRIYDPADVRRIERYRGPLLTGVHTSYSVIDTTQQARIMGVHFKPGGAHAFTGFALDEVQDRHLAAEDFWGAAALTLTDRLAHAPDATARFLLLEEALHRRVVSPAGPHAAVQEAVAVLTRTPGLVPIESLAAQTGLSHRRFIELFRRQAGLPPKLFSRILRFQQTLARVHGAVRLPDWCEVAFDAGYYDQSHLIRDFRQFAGLTPAAYFALKGEHKNHVPLPVPVLDGDGGQIRPIPEG